MASRGRSLLTLTLAALAALAALLLAVEVPVAHAATLSARIAELDPTLVFDFPAKDVYALPGQAWTVPARVNEDVGGRPATLQKKVRGRWVTIKHMRARKRHLDFTVTEPRAGTFQYRIQLPAHGGFEALTTKTQTVHVGPITDANRQHFVPTTIAGSFSGQEVRFGVTQMSWTGSVSMDLLPYRLAGIAREVFYQPTTASVAWSANFTDFTGCLVVGGGTLGMEGLAWSTSGSGAPDEWLSIGRAQNEYGFELSHLWDKPVLTATRTCPGSQPSTVELTNSLGVVLDAAADSYVDRAPQRLEYVAGLPTSGWVRMAGGYSNTDGSGGPAAAWDLAGSGFTPYVTPR
jgi:hypothetical protein